MSLLFPIFFNGKLALANDPYDDEQAGIKMMMNDGDDFKVMNRRVALMVNTRYWPLSTMLNHVVLIKLSTFLS